MQRRDRAAAEATAKQHAMPPTGGTADDGLERELAPERSLASNPTRSTVEPEITWELVRERGNQGATSGAGSRRSIRDCHHGYRIDTTSATDTGCEAMRRQDSGDLDT